LGRGFRFWTSLRSHLARALAGAGFPFLACGAQGAHRLGLHARTAPAHTMGDSAKNHPDPHETFLLNPDGSEKKIVMEKDKRMLDAATFTINREDHTLGNLLATQLLRDPNVVYAGYRVPHPLENHIEIKVQVKSGYTPHAALQTAINDSISAVGLLEEKFRESCLPLKDAAGTGMAAGDASTNYL